MTSLYLVSHLDEAPEREFEDHAPLEGDEVPHVLQDKEAWAVVVAVAQVGHHQ